MKRSREKPPKKRGRPPKIDPDAPALTVSTIKWYLVRLLQDGHGVDACANAFKRVFGERVLAEAIDNWRRSGYVDPSRLLKK